MLYGLSQLNGCYFSTNFKSSVSSSRVLMRTYIILRYVSRKGADTVGERVNSINWSNSHHLVEAVASGHHDTDAATKRIRNSIEGLTRWPQCRLTITCRPDPLFDFPALGSTTYAALALDLCFRTHCAIKISDLAPTHAFCDTLTEPTLIPPWQCRRAQGMIRGSPCHRFCHSTEQKWCAQGAPSAGVR
jgi:hypothetical protein